MNNKISLGLEYDIVKNGAVIIRSIGSCEDKDIVIPEFIDGKTVVGIANGAFARSDIKSVALPYSLSVIGKNAFAFCAKLECISAFGVSEIGDRAFMGCDSLTDIGLSSKIKRIGDKCFAYCPSLTTAHLPDSISEMGRSVFEGCRNLIYASLPQGINIIESGTFYACQNLSRVVVPEHLEYIDEYAFAYCISLSDITISKATVVNRDAFFECGQRKAS